MDKVMQDISSISWWFGVFFVGIIINLLVAYLKPYLDGKMSSFIKIWSTRSEKLRERRETRIREMLDNNWLIVMASYLGIQSTLTSIWFFIASFFMLFLAIVFAVLLKMNLLLSPSVLSYTLFIVCILSSLLSFIAAMSADLRAMRIRGEILDTLQNIISLENRNK